MQEASNVGGLPYGTEREEHKNYHCKSWKMVRSKSYKLLFANIPAALGSDYHIFRIFIGSLDN